MRSLFSGGDHRTRGASAERQAEQWLNRQGLDTVVRNYRCRQGEIDLIMRGGNTLVFVEVRLRASREYGGAPASVTARKQQRLVRAARHYLAAHPGEAALDCRFDVLGVAPGTGGEPDFEWITHAFYAE
jgi:putative endonuclease